MGWEGVAVGLFILILLVMLTGYPVAWVLGGLSAVVAYFTIGVEFLKFLPMRVMGVMSNVVLIAVPLFIFMGLVLQKSGMAERLLLTMGRLLRSVPGGLAISTVLVGALLAASTGIVGATVVTMGLISLPAMLRTGYSTRLATATIAASGTLGQIIPPSIVLILLGSVLQVSVGDLFLAAVWPGIALVILYILYIIIYARRYPDRAPSVSEDPGDAEGSASILTAMLAPLLLIGVVLGSIFMGIASPTEAAAVGASGALLLAAFQGSLSVTVVREVARETTLITAMVFGILIGATTFSLVFRGLGGDEWLLQGIEQSGLGGYGFLIVVMLLIFIVGFFIDFIEIIFIIVPVVAPILDSYGFPLLTVGILLSLNLQTSFLTPPFGFSLFYLRGVAPDRVRTIDIYRGIIPFLGIQLVLIIVYALIVLA